MEKVTIAEQIAEVEREIKIRERVYTRWVLNGKITARAAELQLGRMRAVIETLKRAGVEFADRPPGELPTGEVFGPAKVREVERAKVLSALAELIDQRAYYQLVAKLQASDKGIRK
jgi:hypothetical protein